MPHRATAPLAILVATVLAASLVGCAAQSQKTSESTPALAAPTAAIDPAQQEGCFANERAAETQLAAFQAENPGTSVPASLAEMVSQGMLRSIPACPAGGAYSYDSAQAKITCSIHGHY
jgi:competence protein ComGC